MNKINEIVKDIKQNIFDGKYGKIGSKFISIRKFCAKYNVSYASTVKIYNQLKSDGILYVKNKSYYIKDIELSNQKTDSMLIGVHVRDMANNFYSLILNELYTLAPDYNIELVTMCSNNNIVQKKNILNKFIQLNCKGVINLKSLNEDELSDFLRLYPLPIVMCGINHIDNINCAFVMTDDLKTGCHAGKYLLDTKCENFISVNVVKTDPNSDKREKGFIDTLKNHGKTCIKFNYHESDDFTNYYYIWGKKLTELAQKGRVGVFCRHDIIALHIINICNKFKLKIPYDVSIVGYEDLPIANMMSPTLTTFSYSSKELALALITNLLKQIKTPSLPARSISIQTTLLLRNSTIHKPAEV